MRRVLMVVLLASGSCFGLTRDVSGAEPEDAGFEIVARLDGRPWKAAAVRWTAVGVGTSTSEHAGARAVLQAYERVHDSSTPAGLSTDDKGRARLPLGRRGAWMLCVGEGAQAWTGSVQPGLFAPDQPLEIEGTSRPLRVVPGAPIPEGWRLVASRPGRSSLGHIPLAVARRDDDGTGLLLDGMAGGFIALQWVHSAGETRLGDVVGAARGSTIVLRRMPRMDAAAWLQVQVTVAAPDAEALAGARVDVGSTGPRLARLRPAREDTFVSTPDGVGAMVPAASIEPLRGLGAYIQAPGCVPAWTPLARPEGPEPAADLLGHVALQPGAPVTGHAAWAQGASEDDRWVALHRRGAALDDASSSTPRSASCFLLDSDGTFRTWLSPGRWRLEPLRDRTEDLEIDVGPGGLRGVVLPTPAGREVHGTVALPSGRRVEDVLVHAVWGARMEAVCARPDASGRFTVEVPGEARGELTIVVQAPRCAMATHQLSPSGGDIGQVELRPGGSVRIEAKDARGEPLEDWVLISHRVAQEPMMALAAAVVDQDGLAILPGLAPGRHEFVALGQDQRAFDVTFDVREGKETRVKIKLPSSEERMLVAPDLAPDSEPGDVVLAARLADSLVALDAFVVDERGHFAAVRHAGFDSLLVLVDRAGDLLASRPLGEKEQQSKSARRIPLARYVPEPWEVVLRMEDPSSGAVFPTSARLLVDTARKAANPIEEMEFGKTVTTRIVFDVDVRGEALRIGDVLLLAPTGPKISMDVRLESRGESIRSKRLFLQDFVDTRGEPLGLPPVLVEVPAPARIPVRVSTPLHFAVASEGGPVRDAVIEVQCVLPGEVMRQEGDLPRLELVTDASGTATMDRRPEGVDLLARVVRTAGRASLGEPVRIAASQGGRVELAVAKQLEVVVTVLGRQGEPLPNIGVSVWGLNVHDQIKPEAVAMEVTDEQGQVRFIGLASDLRYVVNVQDARFEPVRGWRPADTTVRATR